MTVGLGACASSPPRPVLYPNAHLQQVGRAVADRDIAECRQLALSSGVSEHREGQVGRKAATGAAIGGASAGAWGLVRGSAGERALAGAAAGAAAGTVRGAIQSRETSPVFRNFVQKCLRDKGYEVIGWQ
ncbi:MAG TPA: cell envelope biogenesis protein OmpA [Gammaproteobacteria bacterium]|nr:cell envelope biogenesis protein OmpA [Gammaproteobacteria bacterium]